MHRHTSSLLPRMRASEEATRPSHPVVSSLRPSEYSRGPADSHKILLHLESELDLFKDHVYLYLVFLLSLITPPGTSRPE